MFNYLTLRNREFGRAVDDQLEHMGCADNPTPAHVSRAVRRALRAGAPRFYVAYSTAKHRMSAAGSRISKIESWAKRRQWLDLKACIYRHIDRHGLNLDQAILHALALDRAPCFYLSYRSAMAIYQEYRRNK